jgi:hypothetical protein
MIEPVESLANSMQQVDAVMRLEGFEKSEAMKALDAAILTKRTTVAGAARFLVLHAHIVSARSILASIGPTDARHETIQARCTEQEEALRALAIEMDGAVRVAFGL